MMNNTWDDATLSAYIDGELDADRQNAVLAAMEHNKALSERICSLRRTKDWMRTGYGSATPPPRELPGRKFSWRNLRAGVAASVMALAIGTGAGLLAYGYAEHDDAMARSASSDPHRIVLHIDDSDPEHFGQLLDFTESFLQENRDNGAQVEVVANSGGLDLLRTDRSPYQQRVRELSAKYSNLQFIACMNAIRNLKRAGSDVPLIDDVHTGETAIDHVVKRLQQGWTYRKIDSL